MPAAFSDLRCGWAATAPGLPRGPLNGHDVMNDKQILDVSLTVSCAHRPYVGLDRHADAAFAAGLQGMPA